MFGSNYVTSHAPARPVHDVADVRPGHGDAEEPVPDADHGIHGEEVVAKVVRNLVDNLNDDVIDRS